VTITGTNSTVEITKYRYFVLILLPVLQCHRYAGTGTYLVTAFFRDLYLTALLDNELRNFDCRTPLIVGFLSVQSNVFEFIGLGAVPLIANPQI
jgi:hypothetical protein